MSDRFMPDADQLKAYLADRDVPCPGCGYNLRGVAEPVCPECARMFTHADRTSPQGPGPVESFGYVLFWLTLAPPALLGFASLSGAAQFVTGRFPTSPVPGSGNSNDGFPVFEIVGPFQGVLSVISAIGFCWWMSRIRRTYVVSPLRWLLLNPIVVAFLTFIAVLLFHGVAVVVINA